MDLAAAIGRRIDNWLHNRAITDIMHTAPIISTDDGLILFSMIGTAVLKPYLVAVKSLHQQLKRGRIILLDDGTLTDADKAVLNYHCDTPQLLRLNDIATAPCPSGNCWERLLAILDLRDNAYVIQLDSDTVTLGPMPEVEAAIAANRSFTLAGGAREASLGFMKLDAFRTEFYSDKVKLDHVQLLAEDALTRMPDNDGLKYALGCAGFAGFAKGGRGRDAVTGFSVTMTQMIDSRWNDWGSEQVASNFVIANENDPLLLPYDHYFNHWNEPYPPGSRFIHYIGTHRYSGGRYLRSSRAAIAALAR